MAITVANSNTWKQAAADNVQFTNNVSTGNRMVFLCANGVTGGNISVSDGTNTWESVGQKQSPGDNLLPIGMFTFVATAGQGGTKPTVTVTNGAEFVAIIELAGADPVTALDGTPFTTTGSAATAGGNITMSLDGGFGVLITGSYEDEMTSNGTTLVAATAVGANYASYGSDELSEAGVIGVTFTFDTGEAGDWWVVGAIFKAGSAEADGGGGCFIRHKRRPKRTKQLREIAMDLITNRK